MREGKGEEEPQMAPHPLKAERVHAERMRHLVFRDDLVPCTIPHNRGSAAEVHLSRSQPNHASAMPVVFTARNLFGSTRHTRRLMPNQLQVIEIQWPQERRSRRSKLVLHTSTGRQDEAGGARNNGRPPTNSSAAVPWHSPRPRAKNRARNGSLSTAARTYSSVR